jgi:hypothetical protein
MLANSPNPLKQGISRNHKPWKNFHAKAKLSDTRTSETPRNQTFKRPVIPYKVGRWSKVEREAEAREHWMSHWNITWPIGKSIPSLKETYQHAQAYNKASCLDASHIPLGRDGFGFRNAQQLYPWAKIRQGNKAVNKCEQLLLAIHKREPFHSPGNITKLVRYFGMAHTQAQRMIQASHSNDRLNSGIARMNTVRLNTRTNH